MLGLIGLIPRAVWLVAKLAPVGVMMLVRRRGAIGAFRRALSATQLPADAIEELAREYPALKLTGSGGDGEEEDE